MGHAICQAGCPDPIWGLEAESPARNLATGRTCCALGCGLRDGISGGAALAGGDA